MAIPPLAGLAAVAATPLINAAAQGVANGAASFLDLLSPSTETDLVATSDEATEDKKFDSVDEILDWLGPGGMVGGQLPRLNLDNLPERLEGAIRLLPGKVNQRLKEAGIEPPIPLELELDTTGAVRVSGNHPDKLAIEAALTGDRDIQQLLTFVSSTTTLFQAVERHLEFAKAYEENPEAAVAKYFPFADFEPPRFSISGDQAIVLTD